MCTDNCTWIHPKIILPTYSVVLHEINIRQIFILGADAVISERVSEKTYYRKIISKSK